MSLQGNITVSVTHNALGMPEQYTYRWNGGPLVVVDCRVLRNTNYSPDKKFVIIGPYKMKVLSQNYTTGEFRCLRVGYPFWWLIAWFHWLTKLVRIAYARGIITLAVWGLAHFDASCEPSIRNVYFVRWALGKLGK